MSITETQLIHETQSSTPIYSSPTTDSEEMAGVGQKMDTKFEPIPRPITTSPDASKFCKQRHPISGWTLQAVTSIRNAQISFITLMNEVNQLVRKKVVQILQVFLLLVIGIQTLAIVSMFAMSELPVGIWFLITSVLALGEIFFHTTDKTDSQPVQH